jgi:hypothetical protein
MDGCSILTCKTSPRSVFEPLFPIEESAVRAAAASPTVHRIHCCRTTYLEASGCVVARPETTLELITRTIYAREDLDAIKVKFILTSEKSTRKMVDTSDFPADPSGPKIQTRDAATVAFPQNSHCNGGEINKR